MKARLRALEPRREMGTVRRMSEAFHQKLAFVLKALSTSRGALAAGLGIDKSAVGRWVSGQVEPSAHNLARLSAYVAARVPGFTALDWERSLESLAPLFGATAGLHSDTRAPADSIRLPLAGESRATTLRRGSAYEGFFRSTRPYAQLPGRFIRDVLRIRRGDDGDLRFVMCSGGVIVEGPILLLQNQLFAIGAEQTSGAFAFAIFNGVNTVQAGVLDGLILYCALNVERAPTASAILLERIGDLSGDEAEDDATLAELAKGEIVAPVGAVPPDIVAHLTRAADDAELRAQAEWVLSLPLSRSRSRGLDPLG
jgi:transcriptional regulator with XRE-family HTH domain